MSARPLATLAGIAAGYVAAFCAGSFAVWLHDLGISPADQQAMSGMLAFGDSVLFWAVAAPVAIIPTVLLVRFIRPAPWFWRLHGTTSLLLSLTGLLEAFLLVAPIRTQLSTISTLQMLSPLRVLAAPIFLLLYSPGLLTIARPHRTLTAAACLFELCTGASFVVWLMLQLPR